MAVSWPTTLSALRDIAVVVQRQRIPVGIPHHEVAIDVDRVSDRLRAGRRGPSQLAAGKQRREHQLALACFSRRCRSCARPPPAVRSDSSASASVAILALHDLRIELAAGRILEHAVLHAIEQVALRHDRIVQHRVLGRRQEARIVLVRRVPDPELPGRLLRRVDRRRAGDDAVEIVGESLCGGQGLAAAGRAAVEVRELRARCRRTPRRWLCPWPPSRESRGRRSRSAVRDDPS